MAIDYNKQGRGWPPAINTDLCIIIFKIISAHLCVLSPLENPQMVICTFQLTEEGISNHVTHLHKHNIQHMYIYINVHNVFMYVYACKYTYGIGHSQHHIRMQQALILLAPLLSVQARPPEQFTLLATQVSYISICLSMLNK